MRQAAAQHAFESRLAAQWAVFFARSQRHYQYQPCTFTLSDGQHYTPDFYVEDIGWVSLSKKPGIHEAQEAGQPMPVRTCFAQFYEFASECDEWCYWLGGEIPFWSLSEVRLYSNPCLDALEDPAFFHKAERLRMEWPDSYGWFKLRRHDGPRRLPPASDQSCPLLLQLQGNGVLKDSLFDSAEFAAFNHKAALVAARSTAL